MPNPFILRPTCTIEHNANGSTTYMVTAKHWKVEYIRLGWNPDEKVTKLLMKGFGKEFNRQAKNIEDGSERPHNIMEPMVDNHFFRMRTKMQETDNVF
jgi:hypothetical protein